MALSQIAEEYSKILFRCSAADALEALRPIIPNWLLDTAYNSVIT